MNPCPLFTVVITLIIALIIPYDDDVKKDLNMYNISQINQITNQSMLDELQSEYHIEQGLFVLTGKEICNTTEKSVGCMFNNYLTPYGITMFPKNDNFTYRFVANYNNTQYVSKWPLHSDQAVLIVGKQVPKMRYFGVDNYLLERDNYGFYRFVFGSLGNSVNNFKIDQNNDTFVIIASASWLVTEDVSDIVWKYYKNINELPFPQNIHSEFFDAELRYGDYKPDLFTIMTRFALPVNDTEWATYAENIPINVWKLSYRNDISRFRHLHAYNEIAPDKTNNNELHLLPDVNDLQRKLQESIFEMYSTWSIFGSWTTVSGLEMLNVDTGSRVISDYMCTYSPGDSGDTVYLTSLPQFVLDKEDVFIVYGVNHYAMNNTAYTSIQIYDTYKQMSITAIDDRDLINTTDSPMLFAYSFAYDCSNVRLNIPCKQITYYTDNILGLMGRDYNNVRYDVNTVIPFRYMIITRQFPYRLSMTVFGLVLLGQIRKIFVITILFIIYGVYKCKTRN